MNNPPHEKIKMNNQMDLNKLNSMRCPSTLSTLMFIQIFLQVYDGGYSSRTLIVARNLSRTRTLTLIISFPNSYCTLLFTNYCGNRVIFISFYDSTNQPGNIFTTILEELLAPWCVKTWNHPLGSGRRMILKL